MKRKTDRSLKRCWSGKTDYATCTPKFSSVKHSSPFGSVNFLSAHDYTVDRESGACFGRALPASARECRNISRLSVQNETFSLFIKRFSFIIQRKITHSASVDENVKNFRRANAVAIFLHTRVLLDRYRHFFLPRHEIKSKKPNMAPSL